MIVVFFTTTSYAGFESFLVEKHLSKIEYYYQINQVDSAFYELESLKSTMSKQDEEKLIGSLFLWEGILNAAAGNFAKSTQSLEQGILIATDKKDTLLMANICLELGLNYKKNEQQDSALHYFSKARKYFQILNNNDGLGQIALSVGNIYKSLNYQSKAKELYFEALNYFLKSDNQNKIGSCYNNLGNIYKNEDNIDSAFHYLYLCLAIRNKNSNIKDKAYIYHNLANLHLKVKQIDSAKFYISQSLILKKQLNNPFEMANDYNVLGSIAIEEKKWNEAIQNLYLALNLSEQNNNILHLMDIYKQLGYAHKQNGQFEEASDYYSKFIELENEYEKLKNSEDIKTEIMRYELFTDSLQIKQLELEKTLLEQQNVNVKLEADLSKRNFYYIILILVLFTVIFFIVYLTNRQRLRLTIEHEKLMANQTEELRKIQISKHEKEVLLKEIHHRVKNNLQIINSLIRLQSNFINPSNYKEKLKETENRIRSMALIHEKLYKTGNLSKLSVKNYIEELSINILESYENHKVKIVLKFEIEEREYPIDTLIPIGLIINEILSNTIKHAFYERNEGYVKMVIYNDDINTHLIIQDNGIGADLSYNELKEDSLGIELIESLTDQLDGTFELTTEHGFHYHFKFKLFN